MSTVSSSQFQRDVSRYQDAALSEPLFITNRGRERLVLMSAEEYRRLRRRAREVLTAGELSEAELEQIAKAQVPAGHEHLDSELES